MGNYILSNNNRFYAAIESTFGDSADITPSNRMVAHRLQAHQAMQMSRRLDKTGTRTYLGAPANPRRHTAFDVKTYLTSWEGFGDPGYGPLFQCAMGATPLFSEQLTVASSPSSTTLQTTTPHLLQLGSAISTGSEIRFVTQVTDSMTVTFNAPFSVAPSAGSLLAPTVTYQLTTDLPSCSLYDYWDPIAAVSRVVTGATVDSMNIAVNGDYHEFGFTGLGANLIDSASFQPGDGGVSVFPAEPALQSFDYATVAGHLGQFWLGSAPSQFFTLTRASLVLKNNLEARDQEFGSVYPRAIAAGMRDVATSFWLYAQDDAQTEALYSAARSRNAISMMLQMGQQQGQIMGVYLPAVVPEVPLYDDQQTRLIWEFNGNIAKGTGDDEIVVAFA